MTKKLLNFFFSVSCYSTKETSIMILKYSSICLRPKIV